MTLSCGVNDVWHGTTGVLKAFGVSAAQIAKAKLDADPAPAK